MNIQKLSPQFLIYAISFSVSHGVPGAIPLLPTFQQEFNLDSYQVTNCLSYFSYAALIGTPFAGYFYNKLPKRFFIYLVNFIFLFGIIGSALSPNYSTLLFFRVLQGLGSSAINLLIYILPAEYYSGLERAKIMGRGIGAIAVGLFINPLITGYLALISWRYSFFFLSSSTFVTIAILFYTDLTEKFSHPYIPFTYKRVKEVCATPFIPSLLIALYIYGCLDLSIPSLFSLFSADIHHYNSSTIGIIYSFSNFGMFIGSSFLLAKLLRTKYFARILFVYCLCITGLLMNFPHLSMPIIFLSFFAHFCLSGILNPYINYSISMCVSPALLTIGLTVSGTIFRAGQGFGTAVFAYINNKLGYDITFILMGCIYLCIIFLLIPYIRKQQKKLS